MAEAGEQMEQAEQAREAAGDPFNRRVTLSIAISAAVLAAVSMLGNNADNEALLEQGQALRHQMHAAIKYNEATNKWGQYQANNIRGHLYNALADLAEIQLDLSDKQAAKVADWRKRYRRYEDESLPRMKREAEAFELETRQAQDEAEKGLKESQAIQARADRFDFGELGLQLGVVLCSLAILTRKKSFWCAGILCGTVGVCFGITGFFGLFLGD